MASPERIFHYTNVDSLALILKSRRIRFTRLDRVDDVREAQEHVGINFGRYFFVSCWTTEEAESIPQWTMYSDRMRGVRIELSGFPFDMQPLQVPQTWKDVHLTGTMLSPIPLTEIWGPRHLVTNAIGNLDNFRGPVRYVDDVGSVYRQSIRKTVNVASNQQSLHVGRLYDLPRNKEKVWEFQKEYRFSLFILPTMPVGPNGPPDQNADFISQAFLNGIEPDISCFDVALSSAALSDLVVRTGPLASPGTIATVEALLAAHCPNGRLQQSSLAGSIRAHA